MHTMAASGNTKYNMVVTQTKVEKYLNFYCHKINPM